MERKRSPKESDYLPKRGNPLQETVCYRLGGTIYEVHTSCGGTKPLYDKIVRLIRSEAIVRKYVRILELTPTIINEFVKKIIVHAPDKSSGHRRQKIELVWNFIGEVNLPGDDQTVERQRKGRTA